MVLWGRLEEIRAPTIGKAKKRTTINKSMRVGLVPKLLGICGADRRRAYSAMMATNMATESAASDHASWEATRALISPIPRSCSLTLSVTAPLYSTTVS